jgi:hypothetical protein
MFSYEKVAHKILVKITPGGTRWQLKYPHYVMQKNINGNRAIDCISCHR